MTKFSLVKKQILKLRVGIETQYMYYISMDKKKQPMIHITHFSLKIDNGFDLNILNISHNQEKKTDQIYRSRNPPTPPWKLSEGHGQRALA